MGRGAIVTRTGRKSHFFISFVCSVKTVKIDKWFITPYTKEWIQGSSINGCQGGNRNLHYFSVNEMLKICEDFKYLDFRRLVFMLALL